MPLEFPLPPPLYLCQTCNHVWPPKEPHGELRELGCVECGSHDIEAIPRGQGVEEAGEEMTEIDVRNRGSFVISEGQWVWVLNEEEQEGPVE